MDEDRSTEFQAATVTVAAGPRPEKAVVVMPADPVREQLAQAKREHAAGMGTSPVKDPCPKCGKPVGNSEYRVCRSCAKEARRRDGPGGGGDPNDWGG